MNCYVTDANNQRQTASTQLTVHPSSICVGLRCTEAFVLAGKEIPVELIVCNTEGEEVKAAQVRSFVLLHPSSRELLLSMLSGGSEELPPRVGL